jgi:hypothetical protein
MRCSATPSIPEAVRSQSLSQSIAVPTLLVVGDRTLSQPNAAILDWLSVAAPPNR